MNLRQLGRYRTAEGMPKEGNAGSIDAECDSQVVVRSARVEPCRRIGRRPAQRQVTAILGEENSKPGVPFDHSGPLDLADGQIGVAVEAKQYSSGVLRIANDEPGQALAVQRVVGDSTCFGHLLVDRWWLKQDSLLLVPKEQQRADDERDYE